TFPVPTLDSDLERAFQFGRDRHIITKWLNVGKTPSGRSHHTASSRSQPRAHRRGPFGIRVAFEECLVIVGMGVTFRPVQGSTGGPSAPVPRPSSGPCPDGGAAPGGTSMSPLRTAVAALALTAGLALPAGAQERPANGQDAAVHRMEVWNGPVRSTYY